MTVADTSVRHYLSSDTGAPVSDSAAGRNIGILDACLVDGYNSRTLASLAVSGGVATATTASPHGFSIVSGTGNTGQVINISGATTQPALNGNWRIATIPSSTSFTFVTDTADVTELGTVTAKVAPLGWTKLYSGTNKAVYQINGGTDATLRVDDTNAVYSIVSAGEGATDIDTLTNKWTSATNWYMFLKNHTSGNSSWAIVGDSRFVAVMDLNTAGYAHPFFFGDLDETVLMPGFAYCSFFRGLSSSGYTNTAFTSMGDSITGSALMRSYTGTAGGVTPVSMYAHGTAATWGSANMAYPAPSCGKLLYSAVDIWQSNSAGPFGYLPGVFSPLHTGFSSTYHGTIFAGDGGEAGRDLLAWRLGTSASNAACLLDLTGPWR